MSDPSSVVRPAACACGPDAAADVPAAGRRRFLQDALLGAAALVALGATRETAPALPARLVRADGVSIDRDAEVILVRWQNAVYAFALSCPHQNTALHWLDADRHFQCPKHKFKYQPDGTYIEGRATRNMDRFTVTREGEQVAVDLGTLHKNDADAAGWAAAVVRLA